MRALPFLALGLLVSTSSLAQTPELLRFRVVNQEASDTAGAPVMFTTPAGPVKAYQRVNWGTSISRPKSSSWLLSENVPVLTDTAGVRLTLGGYTLGAFTSTAGADDRTYHEGSGIITVGGNAVVALHGCESYLHVSYPAPFGPGEAVTGTGFCWIQGSSNAAWASALDPNGARRVNYTFSSFSSVVQGAFGYFTFDIAFTAAPAPPPDLTLTALNGGETWQAGTTRTVTWTLGRAFASLRLELSTDGGATWKILAAYTPASALSVAVKMPDFPTPTALLRLSVPNATPAIQDVSDAPFTITPSTRVQVVTPNGGEAYTAGTRQAINYAVSDPSDIQKVIIEFSPDNGTTWGSAIEVQQPGGPFDWPVPPTPTTQGRLRVRAVDDDGYPAGTDVSDAPFTIAAAPVSSGPPPLRPVPLAALAEPGDTLAVAIRIGHPDSVATGLLGIGFKLRFDPVVFEYPDGGRHVTVEALLAGAYREYNLTQNSWLGGGTLSVAVARENAPQVTGVDARGEAVVTVRLLVRPGLLPQRTRLWFEDVLAVRKDGSVAPVALREASVQVGTAVWPGDTNADGRVNIFDAVEVARYFGQTGPARPEATLAWQAQLAPGTAWVPAAALHADATGDGRVSQNDLLPIAVNWQCTVAGGCQNTPGAAGMGDGSGAANGEGTAVRLAVPARPVGTRFSVALRLGTPQRPLPDVMGVVAELEATPAVLRIVAVRPGTDLDDGDLVAMVHPEATGARTDAAFFRKGGRPGLEARGQAVAVVDLDVLASAPGTVAARTLAFGTPTGLSGAGAAEAVLAELTATTAEAAAAPARFGVGPAAPNPATGRASVAVDLPEAARVTVRVFDVLGRVQAWHTGEVASGAGRRIALPIEGLVPGVYVYRIEAALPGRTEHGDGRLVVR